MRRFPIVILLASALCAPLAASASIMFVAHLSVDQEPAIAGPTTDTGAPRPVPFGEGTFVLNDLQDQLTMDVSVFDIDVTGTQTPDTNDNLRAAHIHELPDLLTPTGPVRWGFFGAPFNDLVAPTIVVTPFATGVGGRFVSVWNAAEGNNTTLTAVLPGLLNNLTYINFHTVQNPGGEIRGQLLRVPEPATLALVLLGALLVVLRRSHRQAGRLAG